MHRHRAIKLLYPLHRRSVNSSIAAARLGIFKGKSRGVKLQSNRLRFTVCSCMQTRKVFQGGGLRGLCCRSRNRLETPQNNKKCGQKNTAVCFSAVRRATRKRYRRGFGYHTPNYPPAKCRGKKNVVVCVCGRCSRCRVGDLCDRTGEHPHIKSNNVCLLYTSPSPRDKRQSRMPSSA